MSIELFNPKDVPFGSLSNNSINYMLICDEQPIINIGTPKNECESYTKWNTVTRYIYCSMITNYVYKNILKNKKYAYKKKETIYSDYLKYKKKSSDDVILNSLNESLKVKFENPDMLKILLSTENSVILYTSNNELLGTGSNNTGSNFVGLYLMQLRDNIINTKIQNEKNIQLENNLFKTYIIYNLLIKDITLNGDDLSAYIDKPINSIDDMLNFYFEKTPKEEFIQKFNQNNERKITEDDIMQKIKQEVGQRLLDDNEKKFLLERLKTETELKTLLELSIKNPRILILYIRKKHLKNLKENLNIFKLNKVFNFYIDYILKIKFPEIPEESYEIAKNSQLKKISGFNQEILKNEVFNKIDKLLPAPLYEEVQKYLKNVKTPTDEEMLEAEDFNLQSFINVEEKNIPKEESVIKKIKIESGNPSINYVDDLKLLEERSLQLLSPTYYTGMLKIKGMLFPSVTHYIVANLFASIPDIGTLKNAIDYMLIDKELPSNTPANWKYYKTISDEYFNFLKIEDAKRLKYFATIGINKKFEDRHLQNLLIQTETKKIIWNDYEDEILGVGNKKNGENFVGKYLMDIRNILIEKRYEENINIISKEDIPEFIENDYFMLQWVNTKIEDICNTVKNISSFLENKYNSQQPIDFPRKKDYKDIREKLYITKNVKIFEMIMNLVYNSCMNIFMLERYVVGDTGFAMYQGFREPCKIERIITTGANAGKLEILFENGKKLIVSRESFDINIPVYFVNIVKSKLSSQYKSHKVIKFLWNYILSMLEFLVNNIQNPTIYNIKNSLTKIENWNSIKKNCKPILKDNYSNCIISAIINVLLSLYNISENVNDIAVGENNQPVLEEQKIQAMGKISKNNWRPVIPGITEQYKFYTQKFFINPIISIDDINLASSIILNKKLKISEKESESDYKSEEDEEVLYENPINEEEKESEGDFYNIYPGEEELAEEDVESEEDVDYAEETEDEDENENEGDDYGEYDGAEDDMEDDIYTLAKYLEENKIFNPDIVNNYEILSKNIMKYVKIIKKYNMEKRIKINRINFFN